MSLTLVISRVQALFEAVGQAWCDKDYIIGFLSIHNEDVELELAALGLSYQEEDIILPAVPANTGTLAAYQATGQPLANMMSLYSLEWKRVGDPVTCFQPVARLDKLIDEDPNNLTEGIDSYSVQGGNILISASSIAVDIRVGTQNLPDNFQSDSDNYIKGTTNWLAYGTAELIGKSRGAGAAKLALDWEKKKLNVADSVRDILVQQEQLTPRRLGGRRSGRTGPLWRWPRA